MAKNCQPLGVTLGDPNGIGPEIFLQAYAAGELDRPAVVFGSRQALEFYCACLRLNVGLDDIRFVEPQAPVSIEPGHLTAQAGAAARECVVNATQAALNGAIAAIVTLPVNKEAVQLQDPEFTGHTELIGQLCGREDVTIMLVSEKLVVTHVSTHVSLATAIAKVKKERVLKIIELTADAVGKLRPGQRIAVAGLNPHAGENGLFGDEEIREIRPAVEEAQRKGIDIDGPIAPDTVFYTAVEKGRYAAIVCMYHDQGHIPLKLLDFEGGVNVTLGLPIVRTSVDHGTAFDIAGKGLASPKSFTKAFKLARMLSSA